MTSDNALKFLYERVSELLERKKILESKVQSFEVKCDIRTIDLNVKVALEIISQIKKYGDFTMKFDSYKKLGTFYP